MEAASIREGVVNDAIRVAEIGAAAMRAQNSDLVDPIAVDAAVAQTYSVDSVADCINLCSRTPSSHFLVAERDGYVIGYLHFDCLGPDPNSARGGPGVLPRPHGRHLS